MVIPMFPRVPPYLDLNCDQVLTFNLAGRPRTFRVISYGRVQGEPLERGGIAVFDEDYGLVLNDGLAAECSPAERTEFVESLAQKGFDTFRTWVNSGALVRHLVGAKGEIPW